ncbi:hypothetical protein AAFN90_00025 [Erwiniaceae bacterium CAU 1747]
MVRHDDTRSRMVTLRNENGESCRFVWGCNDRLLEAHGPDVTVTRYQYGACDRPVTRTFVPETPQAQRVTFDAAGKLTGEETPDGTTTFISYNAAGLLTSATLTHANADAPQNVSFEYDRLGRLRAETRLADNTEYLFVAEKRHEKA